MSEPAGEVVAFTGSYEVRRVRRETYAIYRNGERISVDMSRERAMKAISDHAPSRYIPGLYRREARRWRGH